MSRELIDALDAAVAVEEAAIEDAIETDHIHRMLGCDVDAWLSLSDV